MSATPSGVRGYIWTLWGRSTTVYGGDEAVGGRKTDLAVSVTAPMSVVGPRARIGEERMGGRQARLVLALLVVERPRAVSRSELADALWPTRLPMSWEPALRGVLSRVRGAFAAAGFPASEVLTSAFGCYQLHLPAGTIVDIEAATSAVEAADAALGEGDGVAACREAQVAVQIAARPFLVGEDAPWVRRVQTQLRARLLRALEVLSEGRLLQGEVVLAVKAAEQAVALDPLRESAHRCLMAAHAAAGNRGDALRAYERCRRALADELGVGPSDETTNAYVRLLGTEPAAAGPTATPAPSALPFPEALHVASPFTGRERELGLLRDAWRAARSGRRRVVLLGGEAGIGRTALSARLASEVHAAGGIVLYGCCDERLNTPYEPFGEALGRYLTACSIDQLRQQLRGPSRELVRLAPDLVRRLPDLAPLPDAEPEAHRHRLFAATSALLASVTEGTPVLLVIDDLQWCGTGALLLLRYLTRTLESSRLMILITFRDDELEANPEASKTLSDLKRAAGVHELVLPGLDVRAIEAIAGAAGAPPAARETLAPVILEESGGNTRFVTELVRHMAGSDTTSPAEALRAEALLARLPDVPASVAEAVRRRRSGLTDVAQRVLSVASVVGRHFELDVVARVTPLDPEVVLDALDEAVAMRLVAEVPGAVGEYRFVQGLMHRVICQAIGSTRRARQHALVAAAIEEIHGDDLGAHIFELSHHYWEARSVGGVAKAVHFALLAGEHALQQHAFEKAVVHFQRALSVGLDRPADQRRRCEALIAMATAQRKAGHLVAARDTYLTAADLARRLGDPEALAACTLGLAGEGHKVSTLIADDIPDPPAEGSPEGRRQ